MKFTCFSSEHDCCLRLGDAIRCNGRGNALSAAPRRAEMRQKCNNGWRRGMQYDVKAKAPAIAEEVCDEMRRGSVESAMGASPGTSVRQASVRREAICKPGSEGVYRY